MSWIQRAKSILPLLSGRLWLLTSRLSGSLDVAPNSKVVGKPSVRVVTGARIAVGECVVLNSSRLAYHAGMYSPVTLIADKPGAIISIGRDSRLNGAVIHSQASVKIGSRVLMAAQATVLDSNGHVVQPIHRRLVQRDEPRPVVIEDDVWIGLGAVILPGSHIGRGSVIGANSVVSGKVPAFSMVRVGITVSALRELQ